MKKISIILITLIFLSLFISCTGNKTNVPVTEVYFFYLELCPGCDDYILAEKLSESLESLVKKKTFKGEALNIIHDEDAEIMKSILTEKNLADISHVLPLLIVDNTYTVGYEEINAVMDELTK